MSPLVRVELFSQFKSLAGWDGFHPVYPGSILALVVLRHPSHRKKAGGLGFHQQLLKFVDDLNVAMVTSLKDALL
jgi:hypothetical protein